MNSNEKNRNIFPQKIYKFGLNIFREYKFVNIVLSVLIIVALMLPFIYNLYLTEKQPQHLELPYCILKHHTGHDCPTCGLTRSVLELYNGNFDISQSYHPAGFLIIVFLLFELLMRTIPFLKRSPAIPLCDIIQIPFLFFVTISVISYFAKL